MVEWRMPVTENWALVLWWRGRVHLQGMAYNWGWSAKGFSTRTLCNGIFCKGWSAWGCTVKGAWGNTMWNIGIMLKNVGLCPKSLQINLRNSDSILEKLLQAAVCTMEGRDLPNRKQEGFESDSSRSLLFGPSSLMVFSYLPQSSLSDFMPIYIGLISMVISNLVVRLNYSNSLYIIVSVFLD